MDRRFEQKPGGASLVQQESSSDVTRDTPGKSTLTQRLGNPDPPTTPVEPGRRALTDSLEIARSSEAPAPASVPPQVVSALASSEGEPLPEPQRWSQRVGADVSDARVVTSSGAAAAAASIQARAFTVGNRVFMGAGHDASTDGGGLLAHELTHVTQQRGAAAPASWDQLGFVDRDDAREVSARAHDGTGGGGSQVAIARDVDPEGDIDASTYRQRYSKAIGTGVYAFLQGQNIPTGSRFVTFPAPMLTGPTLLRAPTTELDSKLDGWLGRDKVNAAVDKARAKGRVTVQDSNDNKWVEDKHGAGPDRWFADVGSELGAMVQQLLRQSLDRVVPRFISAAVATAHAAEAAAHQSLVVTPKPRASDIIPSAPIDVPVIQALAEAVSFDAAAYRNEYPDEQGALGAVRTLAVKWEAPRNGTYWLRVTAPANPTVEEVAQTLFGSTLKTAAIAVVAPPLFGLSSAESLLDSHKEQLTTLGADLTRSGDAVTEGMSGPLADELAKAQGNGRGTKAQSKNDVLRWIDESIAILPTIEKSGAVFGMGKNPYVAALTPLRKSLSDRRTKIAAAANDGDALAWAGQVEVQQEVLTKVAFGFDRHAKRLADLTKMVEDPAITKNGFNLPPYVREAMNHVAMGYTDAALASELPQTADAKLANVEDEAGALPITFMEGALESVQRVIDDARTAKHDAAEHASYGVDDMRAREVQLKARLAGLRARIKTDPEGSTKELAEISKLVQELQQESELVGNMDQIDAAWRAVDESVSWFWSSVATHNEARALKAEGDGYHAQWKAIYTAWKTKDPAKQKQAKTDLEALRKDERLRAWFGKVASFCKSAQTEQLIGKLVALLVITIVTMGVGDLVVAGAAGWELSAGTTAVLAGGAEAATFTALNQIFLDPEHSFGHIVYELGANWAMFGVLRRFQMFAEVEKLSKLKTITGSTLILAASTYAKADLDKQIHDGRHLTADEVKQIALQGMVMAIALHAIAPLAKPLFTELEGSAYSFAARLRASNKTRSALEVSAKALEGSKDFKAAQEYVSKEKAWLDEKIKVLEEVEAQVKAEEASGKPGKGGGIGGGIGGKIKMSAEDLAALKTDLKAKQTELESGALPLLTLEPKGPGLFTCPREQIVEVTKAMGEVTKVSEDPTTLAKTYEVKLPDGSIAKVMERVDPTKASWVADLRASLDGVQRARFDARMRGKTPEQIHDQFGGNAEQAKALASGVDLPKDLVDLRAGLSDIARSTFDAKYRQAVRDPAQPSAKEIETFRQSLDKAKTDHGTELNAALEVEAAGMPKPIDPTSCFIAGTLVLGEAGARPIETLAVCDRVLATDVATSARAYEGIATTYARTVPVVVDIDLGDVTITCSPEHPFFVPRLGWCKAGDLDVGVPLLAVASELPIRDIRRRSGEFTVFNVEVEHLHVYHVSALGILVHNKANAHHFFKDRKATLASLDSDAAKLGELEGATTTTGDANKVDISAGKREDLAKRIAKLKQEVASARKSTDDLTIAEHELIEPAKAEQTKLADEIAALSRDLAEAKKPFETRVTELTNTADALDKRQADAFTKNKAKVDALTKKVEETKEPKAKQAAQDELAAAQVRHQELISVKQRLDQVKRMAKLLVEDPASDSGTTAQKVELDAIENKLRAAENELEPGTMLGIKGAQFESETMWLGEDGYERIDVENPNPGQRAGQIHYQPKKGVKWYYDPKRDKLYNQKTGDDAPQSVQDKLKDPDIRAGIEQGLKMLGEK